MILSFLSLDSVGYRVRELEQPIKINLRANEKERRTDLISDEKEIQERWSTIEVRVIELVLEQKCPKFEISCHGDERSDVALPLFPKRSLRQRTPRNESDVLYLVVFIQNKLVDDSRKKMRKERKQSRGQTPHAKVVELICYFAASVSFA